MYGYARVSTAAQDHADQVAELKAAGCGQVFAESASGAAGRRRPQLARAQANLEPGDVLAVTRLNRLARSTRDALNLLEAITAKGAGFRSLREAWADTTTPGGRLMVTIMSGLAEFDREMILERTGEGRANAKARGVKLGRPSTLAAKAVEFVREQRTKKGGMSISELRTMFNVSRSTITRAARADYAAAAPPVEGPRQVDIEDVIIRRAEVPKD